jgi:DNA modification methylase
MKKLEKLLDEQYEGVSRFFYCPKTNKSDRSEGNIHPTVKPTDLMLYLIRLVTPKGGVTLDPFMGRVLLVRLQLEVDLISLV